MKLFKKKEVTEEDKFLKEALKKIPKKRRKKALELYSQYQKGLYLRVDKEYDNKKLMEELKKEDGKISKPIQEEGNTSS